MEGFLDALEVELVSEAGRFGRGQWRLLVPLRFKCETLYTVPNGFITDFATVPRVPLLFEVLGERAHKAAVLHDWAYECGLMSRYGADLLFLKAMKVTNVPLWVRLMMFCAVRLFGKSSYRSRGTI